jgi:hypothetical protein
MLIPAGTCPDQVSEHTVPPRERDYNHNTDYYNQDFVPAPLANTNRGAVAFSIIGRPAHLACL